MRGDPACLITYEARTWPSDLILMRAHNRTDFRSLMLGSVAKSVVRNAPCSVEIIRAVRDYLSVVGNGHMKIILAADGSEESSAAARTVAKRPWPEGTEVKVMSMVNPLIYSIEELRFFDSGGTLSAHRAIGEAAQILNEAGLKTSAEVIAGRPCKRIINEARDWRADLIVVGKHDRRGLRRLLEGSVSERVAVSAPCSVKIVRDHELTMGR
jgi:nucleotide-binding universal stress UspA family protein